MIWKRFLNALVKFSVIFSAISFLTYWLEKLMYHDAQRYSIHQFILDIIVVVSASLGLVGYAELKRSGDTKIRRILMVSLGISPITFLLLISLKFGSDLAIKISFYELFALIASPFPLALYLNRKQKQSTPQTSVANAS
jgi:hypothetical protein